MKQNENRDEWYILEKIGAAPMIEKKQSTGVEAYINSFVYEENFAGKRFNRYMQKTEAVIIDFIKNFYDVTYKRFAFFVLGLLYWHFKKDEKLQAGVFAGIIKRYPSDKISIDVEKKILEKVFLSFDVECENISLLSMIEEEFANACKLHIARKCTMDPNITEDNYNITIPSTNVEILDIINNTVNWSIVDVERFLRNIEKQQFDLALWENDRITEICKEHDEDIKKIKRLEKENESLQQQLAIQKSKLHEKEDADILQPYKEENVDLRRQLASFQKKYDVLEKKYQNIIQQTEEPVHTCEKECEDVEIDMNARYIFIVENGLPVTRKIIQEFPNCRTVITNENINAESTDMVVAITKNLGHVAYNAIKSQCKRKGIPFVHCDRTNMDFIKKTIYEFNKR